MTSTIRLFRIKDIDAFLHWSWFLGAAFEITNIPEKRRPDLRAGPRDNSSSADTPFLRVQSCREE
jgi:hypothetical protein